MYADFYLDSRCKPGRENVVPDALFSRPDLKVALCALFNSSPLLHTDFLRKL